MSETLVTVRILFELDADQQVALEHAVLVAVADSIENFCFDIRIQIVEPTYPSEG